MKRPALAIVLILALVLISGPAGAQVNGVAIDSSKGVLLLGSPAGAANCKAATTGAIRYNSTTPGIEFCNGTAWTGVGANKSMFTGWPDAIVCNVTSPGYGPIVMLPEYMPYTPNGLYYYYNMLGGFYYIFNPDGTYNSNSGQTFDCGSSSISTLYSTGHAFNLVSGP